MTVIIELPPDCPLRAAKWDQVNRIVVSGTLSPDLPTVRRPAYGGGEVEFQPEFWRGIYDQVYDKRGIPLGWVYRNGILRGRRLNADRLITTKWTEQDYHLHRLSQAPDFAQVLANFCYPDRLLPRKVHV